MGERTIRKYSFLTRLFWAIFGKPLKAKMNEDTADAIDEVVNADHVEIYKEIEGK